MSVGALALVINLYRMSMKIEKNHCAQDPEKVSFLNQVGEIQDRVNEIWKDKVGKSSKENETCFKD